MLIISAGMPRSGSAWVYNLTNDLVAAAGGQDAREVRERVGLESILSGQNCQIGRVAAPKLLRLLLAERRVGSFTVKTHHRPTLALKTAMKSRRVRATYVYRDPRDVALSAIEEGERMRERGVDRSFAQIRGFEDAIEDVRRWLSIYDAWTSTHALCIRYEELRSDTAHWAREMCAALELSVPDTQLVEIVERYGAGNSIEAAHFQKGMSGRFREVFSPSQIEYANAELESHLVRMGYE